MSPKIATNASLLSPLSLPSPATTSFYCRNSGFRATTNSYVKPSLLRYHMPSYSTGMCSSLIGAALQFTSPRRHCFSGVLGAGLAIFSRFPIVETANHPYSLNGAPIDVISGDWMVGKSAASVVISHPTLGRVQIFNTHVGDYCFGTLTPIDALLSALC